VAGRVLLLWGLIIVISAPAAIVAAVLVYFHQNALSFLFFQIVSTLTILPIGNLYLLNLYIELEKRFSASEPKA
jgi:hypothetical protein